MKTKNPPPIDLVPYRKTDDITHYRHQPRGVANYGQVCCEFICYESYDSNKKISLTFFFVATFLSGSLIRFFSYNGTYIESFLVGIFSVLWAFILMASAYLLLKIGGFIYRFFRTYFKKDD